MEIINLMPVRFSKVGLKSLKKQLGINDLNNDEIRAYFESATQDDLGTVYFNEKTNKYIIDAHFETGSWSNDLKLIAFNFEDFEYNDIEL